MKNLELRKGTAIDVNAVFALAQKLASSFSLAQDRFEESYSSIIDDESAFLMVAAQNDRIIGYCLGFDHYAFYANGRLSWLEEIFIEEEYRSLKIGKMLMGGFESWCVSRNSKMVNTATHSAPAFYEALGYKQYATYYRKKL